jgi:hypothetical protein
LRGSRTRGTALRGLIGAEFARRKRKSNGKQPTRAEALGLLRDQAEFDAGAAIELARLTTQDEEMARLRALTT